MERSGGGHEVRGALRGSGWAGQDLGAPGESLWAPRRQASGPLDCRHIPRPPAHFRLRLSVQEDGSQPRLVGQAALDGQLVSAAGEGGGGESAGGTG